MTFSITIDNIDSSTSLYYLWYNLEGIEVNLKLAINRSLHSACGVNAVDSSNFTTDM